MHYSRNGHFEIKYNWKDLLVDAAIMAVILGAVDLLLDHIVTHIFIRA